MSVSPDTQSDLLSLDHPSAPPSLTLSSNNPFRNRAASPSVPQTPTSPFDDPPPRPVSRNPFLEAGNNKSTQPAKGFDNMATATPVDSKKPASPTAEEIFDSLTLEDKKPSPPPHDGPMGPPRQGPPRGGPPPMGRRGPPRGENMPPPGRRFPPTHRPSRSQEEALRARRMQGNGNGPPMDPSSPQKRMARPRRNSESSVASGEKPLTDEERKQRELRRRERERRHRENKDKPPKSSRRMDIIDQLDATSIFGTGLFHHDGPFDALNPHRNRTGSRRAPMQAFPKDSLNNVIGGSGPLNARPDHATFMGHADDEAFKEFSTNTKPEKMGSSGNMPVFDPTTRGSILHGDETMGLGTSTFLEGTPAARTAVQRREAEKQQETVDNGLQRKKSLAQRIRGMNRPGQRDFQPSGRMTNPEGVYGQRSPPIDYPLGGATSGSMQPSSSERNPFFAEYDTKKGEEIISVRRTDSNGLRSPSSPPRKANGLERRATTDATAQLPEESQPKQGGGLLARVKSLKGGRRTRPAETVPAADKEF